MNLNKKEYSLIFLAHTRLIRSVTGMNKCVVSLLTGCVIGMVVAYHYEDELEDTVHHACRCQRKMMRKVHQLSK